MLPRFARLEARLNQRVNRALSNAMVALPPAPPAPGVDAQEPVWVAVTLDKDLTGGALAPMGAAHSYTVNMPGNPSIGGLEEGDTLLVLSAATGATPQSMRIAGPVEVDASGWLTFEVYPT